MLFEAADTVELCKGENHANLENNGNPPECFWCQLFQEMNIKKPGSLTLHEELWINASLFYRGHTPFHDALGELAHEIADQKKENDKGYVWCISSLRILYQISITKL